jgi:L-fuconolactonase
VTTLRTDAHQHYWRPSRGDYRWLRADVPQLAPLLRNFLPDDLTASLAEHHVVQTVLVQAADSEAETDFMLELASAHDSISGVVGWVDLADAASVATLQRWARHPKFKGVRPMLQDLPDDDWIATAPHPVVMAALLHLKLRLDALVQPWHLPALLRFVQAWPTLPVVIDHAAKPQLARGWGDDANDVSGRSREAGWASAWRDGMAALAAHPQVFCKVSGLLTEAPVAALASRSLAVDALRPVWHALQAWFGTDRLMWGSDWPVLTLAGDFGGWVAVCDALFADLAPADRTRLWHANACRFYGLAL